MKRFAIVATMALPPIVLAAATPSSARAETPARLPVNMTSGLYVPNQIPKTPKDQAFFEAWDCWIQNASALRLAGPKGAERSELALEAGRDCDVDGVRELRFKRTKSRQPGIRYDSYALVSPTFENTPLARAKDTGLVMSVWFADPKLDLFRPPRVALASFSATILYWRWGRPDGRGFQNEFQTKAAWDAVGERVVRHETRGGPCWPPGSGDCSYQVPVVERTWKNSLTGESVKQTEVVEPIIPPSGGAGGRRPPGGGGGTQPQPSPGRRPI